MALSPEVEEFIGRLAERARAQRYEPRVAARSDSVYFAGAGPYVKIGVSNNVASRIATIGAMCPLPVTLLATMPGSISKERALHRRFWRYHHHHEWFLLSGRLAAFVAKLQRAVSQ